MMEEYRRNPLKLYIQDIFRAQQSQHNKYVYEIFGIKFKNVLLHGIVTSVYNTTVRSTNIELSDPTGTIQVYYDHTKSNNRISPECMKDLIHSFAKESSFADKDVDTMSFMLERIENKQKNINLAEGDFLSIVGDIFMDDFKNARMISAYQCNKSSLERDIVWMEDLRYLYDKSYIK